MTSDKKRQRVTTSIDPLASFKLEAPSDQGDIDLITVSRDGNGKEETADAAVRRTILMQAVVYHCSSHLKKLLHLADTEWIAVEGHELDVCRAIVQAYLHDNSCLPIEMGFFAGWVDGAWASFSIKELNEKTSEEEWLSVPYVEDLREDFYFVSRYLQDFWPDIVHTRQQTLQHTSDGTLTKIDPGYVVRHLMKKGDGAP